MPEPVRLTEDVERRNKLRECGLPIGQLRIKLQNIAEFQTVSFYCTLPKQHLEGCAFVGTELVVERRRRG